MNKKIRKRIEGVKRRDKWEEKYLETALKKCNGNQREAAIYMGFCEKTIHNWLVRFPHLKNNKGMI